MARSNSQKSAMTERPSGVSGADATEASKEMHSALMSRLSVRLALKNKNKSSKRPRKVENQSRLLNLVTLEVQALLAQSKLLKDSKTNKTMKKMKRMKIMMKRTIVRIK